MPRLMRRAGAVATRPEQLREVWRHDVDVTTRTVDTHIVELRRKLERDPGVPHHVRPACVTPSFQSPRIPAGTSRFRQSVTESEAAGRIMSCPQRRLGTNVSCRTPGFGPANPVLFRVWAGREHGSYATSAIEKLNSRVPE